MATALDLSAVVTVLLDGGLIKINEGVILESRLQVLSERADRQTLLCIARVLLDCFPPSWIMNVVSNRGVALEYIPSTDLDALEWIGDDLAELLIAVAQPKMSLRDNELRKRLGDAGEYVLIESKKYQGEKVIHVAKISDSFGYDVESCKGSGATVERIEIKAALPNTADRFYISKNECEKASSYGDAWKLVQVTFDASILWKRNIMKKDILDVRMLSSKAVVKLTDFDTDSFRWLDSAEIFPPLLDWSGYELPLPENLEINI
ncbi:MAG: hypothetical protein JWQ10_2664 [Herbaspirillum sp.]|nr:hypothetical protein [Herbaspirillum sp.]